MCIRMMPYSNETLRRICRITRPPVSLFLFPCPHASPSVDSMSVALSRKVPSARMQGACDREKRSGGVSRTLM